MVTALQQHRAKLGTLLRERKARIVLVPILSLAAVALLVVFANLVAIAASRPRGMDMLPQMEREFAQFRLPEGARAVRARSSSSQMSHALVSATYATPVEYDVLRQHYDGEAARNGWTPCGERELYDWFRDLGGKTRSYCKGELEAEIQYAGGRASYGWDYAFSIDWGLH